MKLIESILDFTAAGDFTMYHHLAGSGREELEHNLGFHEGRMSKGAIIAVMYKPDLNALTSSDFSLGASTRWSRSCAAAPWAPEFTKFHTSRGSHNRMEANAIESALALRGQDVFALRKKVLAFFKSSEKNMPAKVFPLWEHEDWMTYPSPEVGVPQFRLHNKVHWVVKHIVQGK
jgi:hypothetical protein